MRVAAALLVVVASLTGSGSRAEDAPAPGDAFTRLQALAGEWQTELPGFGALEDTIRLISKGTAVEETLGTAADNETSIYTRDGDRILLTHYCAMTPAGHQVRLETAALQRAADRLEFLPAGSTNLRDPQAPHMRLLSVTLVDRNHFSERWTKTEAGKDTVFEMSFTRR
jgi:hypothetical protein